MCLYSFHFFMFFSTKLFKLWKKDQCISRKVTKNVKIWNKNMYMGKIDHLFTPWYKDKNLINSINFHPTWACTNDWFTNFLTYWTSLVLSLKSPRPMLAHAPWKVRLFTAQLPLMSQGRWNWSQSNTKLNFSTVIRRTRIV